MRRLLLGCLILLTACQSTTGTAVPKPAVTAASQTPVSSVQNEPVPATATVTATSAPTSSPTAVPQYFTEEFDSTLGAWSSFLTGGDSAPELSFENGSLKLNFSSPHTWYYALHTVHDYKTVHLDAKFNSAGNQPVSIGLFCNYTEPNGWLEYNISTDGTYNILVGQWLANRIAQYTPVMSDRSEYLTPDRTDYEIGLTCEPGVLWLYINGKLFRKINVSQYELKEGKVGIAAAVFQNVPATAYFEWFRVSEPSP